LPINLRNAQRGTMTIHAIIKTPAKINELHPAMNGLAAMSAKAKKTIARPRMPGKPARTQRTIVISA
jgi:hypothetical protein